MTSEDLQPSIILNTNLDMKTHSKLSYNGQFFFFFLRFRWSNVISNIYTHDTVPSQFVKHKNTTKNRTMCKSKSSIHKITYMIHEC